MQYVFIHGLGQTPSSWNKTFDYLHEEMKINCPNLTSLLTGKEITYGSLYKAFQDYCEMIEEPLNLCGISLGAVLALNYAIDHSEKVKSLILIAPQYKMLQFLLRLQNIVFRFMPSISFQDMGFSKDNVIHLSNSMQHLDFTDTIRYISCPTMVVCGKRDKVNKKSSKRLANMISNALYCEIRNAGHEVNIDAPRSLAQVITELKETPK